MQMETLTPALLNELIEKIEVHSIEGKGKNRTQKIIIHYRFIGVIENPIKEDNIVLEPKFPAKLPHTNRANVRKIEIIKEYARLCS